MMSKLFFLGIDPGIEGKGGWAVLGETAGVECYTFDSFRDFHLKLHRCVGGNFSNIFCCIEAVHSSPQQGVVSAFTFGSNFGGWKGCLEVLEINYQLVRPQEWQRMILGKFNPGDSKITAAKYAQKKWPELNLSLFKKDSGKVDALCIARYAQKITENCL